MNAVNCPACSSDVPIPDPAATPELKLSCPACGERLAVSVFVDGAETLFQPQLLGDEAEAEATAREPEPATAAAGGSETIVISATPPGGDAAREAEPAVDTVLQATLILAGAEPGSERFTLTAPRTSVGREKADIVIADPALSSRHFEVEVRAGEYFLRDLDSSNGTTLNGARIRAAELTSGDTIGAGRSRFTFRTFEAISL